MNFSVIVKESLHCGGILHAFEVRSSSFTTFSGHPGSISADFLSVPKDYSRQGGTDFLDLVLDRYGRKIFDFPLP